MKPLKFSIHVLAGELGVADETLRRKLRDLDVAVGHGKKITIKQAFAALHSDLDAERTRETRARADLLEMERKEKEQSLVPMATARKVINDVLGPLKVEMLSASATLSARCNPGDPELARIAIADWARQTLQNASDAISRV